VADAFRKTILCIGAGHVGGPTMAVIARHCPEYRVEVVDVNAERVAAWNSDRLPIYEPGLDDVVRETRGRNLFFYDDVEAHVDGADIIFVSVNTPTKTFGEGAGRAADLQYWERTARTIARCSTTPKIVVEKSTLPVRTAEAIEDILRSAGGPAGFQVVSNPEFLAEGTAIRDLEEPDRVLIGGRDTEEGRAAVEQAAEIYAHWLPPERIITMDIWSSELAKLTANAFLAQRVSSINAVSALCERTGADVRQVARAVGMDSRIGPQFLRAGIGFGGSCFRKDILNLAYLCDYHGLPEAAAYWQQVVELNEHQKRRFVRAMVEAMYKTLAGKRIAVLGVAFKPDTGDTRDSPAVDICRQLADERASLVITDPEALENARRDLEGCPNTTFVEDPYEAAEGAHAVALLTGWPEYAELDFARIYGGMERPPFIFDGWGMLDHEALAEIGFHVYRVGAPGLAPPTPTGSQ
jgi:UDPglucose 6-dehydrogenase